jgi:hypothetical protein
MATDATLVKTPDTPGHDTLVPDPQVQKEFGVTAMSIWRWDRDPELIKLGWPPPIRIRSRKFRSRIALENFKRVMAHGANSRRRETPVASGLLHNLSNNASLTRAGPG